MNNPANRRWGDLLIAEHIALQVLSNYGFVASESQIIESQTEYFLNTIVLIESADMAGEAQVH